MNKRLRDMIIGAYTVQVEQIGFKAVYLPNTGDKMLFLVDCKIDGMYLSTVKEMVDFLDHYIHRLNEFTYEDIIIDREIEVILK